MVVVGGGVVGLSAAVRLQETGRSMCVLTADPPERTTSHLAAAVWFPTGFGDHTACSAGRAAPSRCSPPSPRFPAAAW